MYQAVQKRLTPPLASNPRVLIGGGVLGAVVIAEALIAFTGRLV